MFIKYKGKTENFVYKGADFSNGPAEVDDVEGAEWILESPGCFVQVIPAETPEAPKAPAKVVKELKK